MTPPTIPGYDLLRYLGGGPSFEVWEGHAVGETIPVAVKLPRIEALERPSTLTLLRREVRAAQTVQHPRLVRLLDSRLVAPPYFLVLEYVPGESMKGRIKRGGRLPLRTAIWATRQAAEAVAALHAVGLVHADVKPGNVLLDPRGKATLIDLGFTHKPGENRELLKSGFVMGTASYLAPELCRVPTQEGPAADIFALGTTLFECLTGRLPYGRTLTASEAMRKRRDSQPRQLASMPGEWPARLTKLNTAMLAIEPTARPTASRVVRELVTLELELLRGAQARRSQPAAEPKSIPRRGGS